MKFCGIWSHGFLGMDVAKSKLIDDDQRIASQLVNKLASQSHFNKVQLGSSRVVCGEDGHADGHTKGVANERQKGSGLNRL